MFGSMLLGTGVGQASSALLPHVIVPSNDEQVDPVMTMVKHGLYTTARIAINVYVLHKLSELLLKDTSSDPTNGALLLYAMFQADTGLQESVALLNEMLHLSLNKGGAKSDTLQHLKLQSKHLLDSAAHYFASSS